MNLYIARHGETEYNVKRLFQGGTGDSPLTENGKAQAQEMGRLMEGIPFDAIYSSPLQRAVGTVNLAFPNRSGIPFFTDERLVEILVGDMQGMDWDEAEKLYPDAAGKMFTDPAGYIPPPKGETLEDMMQRIGSFLEDLAKKEYKNVFVQTHGYVLKVVYAWITEKNIAAILKTPFYDNCAVVRYKYNGKWIEHA